MWEDQAVDADEHKHLQYENKNLLLGKCQKLREISFTFSFLEDFNFENDGDFDRQVDEMEKNNDIPNEYCN